MIVEGLLVWRAGVVDGYGLKIERGALVAAAARMAGVLVRRGYREDELPLGQVVAAEVRGDDLVVSVEVLDAGLAEDLRKGWAALRPTVRVGRARWESRLDRDGGLDREVQIAESLDVLDLGATRASEAEPIPGGSENSGGEKRAGVNTEGGDDDDGRDR